MNIIKHINENKVFIGLVNFDNNDKDYAFFTNISNLKKEDKVIVDTVNGLQIVTFNKYLTKESADKKAIKRKTFKWILQKIDLTFQNYKQPKKTNIILK